MEIQGTFLLPTAPVAIVENRRRRGRPCGAQTAVVADGQLGNHHFAFLRSVAEGLDPGICAERYLVGCERVDPRTARVVQRQLLERVVAVAKALNDIGLREASELLEARDVAPVSNTSRLPSLAEFADTLDTDMYSESDLIELYQEQYGSQSQSIANSYRVKVKALDYLQGRLAKTPHGDDSLAQWLPQRLCVPLQRHGVLSLNNLIRFINSSGRTWYRLVPRLGRERAARLMTWLIDVQKECQEKLQSDFSHKPRSQDQVIADNLFFCVTAPERSMGKLVLVPLEQLLVPEKFSGQDGLFRSQEVNTLSASTDLQAIQAWLNLLANKSVHTQVAYKREIERFYLWALLECRKALSSLDAQDCESYKAFLKSPPAHWVCALPYPRNHVLWRPFRGPLTSSSIERSLAAVARLFADLLAAHYLRANPMPRLNASHAGSVRLDVMRSFTIDDQVCIAATLKDLPDTASARRTQALVILLLSSGLRISETQTTHEAIFQLREQERLSEHFGLRVIGKGNKERVVPMRTEVLQALQRHQLDLSRICTTPACQLPLIGTLKIAPCSDSTSVRTVGGALSIAGMQTVLKSFFAKVAKQHHSGVDFAKVSAHWMRHTFAHQVLAATDKDLAVVQQLLGHGSIQTTANYVKADMESRTLAINAMASPLFSQSQENYEKQ